MLAIQQWDALVFVEAPSECDGLRYSVQLTPELDRTMGTLSDIKQELIERRPKGLKIERRPVSHASAQQESRGNDSPLGLGCQLTINTGCGTREVLYRVPDDLLGFVITKFSFTGHL